MSFHFSIFGEVAYEGRYTSYDTRTNIFDAIALAGNLTDYADRKRIKIVRKDGNNFKTAYIDLLSEDALSSEFYFLRPNDQIIVPPLKVRVFKNTESRDLTPLVSLIASITTLIVIISTR
jgi:polysaccharide export outer membrane protein